MMRRLQFLAACLAVVGLVFAGTASAQGKGKGPGAAKAKSHKHVSGKNLLGDKIKQNGHHKLEDHGKFSSSVDVSNGKIAGVKVKHADKGDVPVTKYKTTKKMAEGPRSGAQFASYQQAQYVVTLWIGYAYIDDWGEEVIYWFPVDMIIDGDYGAVEYYEY
ncbi:MAG TPA: hypothetical protein VJS92_16250 [Candidatus Polarisedimenticolaceae bacterium]|nr:hypothetical protein [Candidatus Polarisedimenticolaceae bacterium]